MKFNLNNLRNKINSSSGEIKMHMLLVALVIVGAVNWGLTAFGYNLVEMLSKFINSLLNMNLPIDKLIYIIVAGAGIMLAVKRTTWLPFLGKSVLPSYLVPLRENSKMATTKISINTVPNSKIAYWSAFNKSPDQNVITAYDDYSNSGVVLSDDQGNAVLSIVEGAEYTVPSGKTISKHVHYRIINDNAMMGDVITVKY